MIEYTSKFKSDIAKAYKGPMFKNLVLAIEGNCTNKVRVLLEEGIDDYNLYNNIYTKSRYLKKRVSKQQQALYNTRVKLYSVFMQNFINNYDSTNRCR